MDYKTRGFLNVIEVRYRAYMDVLEEDTGPGPRLRHAFSAAALFLIQPHWLIWTTLHCSNFVWGFYTPSQSVTPKTQRQPCRNKIIVSIFADVKLQNECRAG